MFVMGEASGLITLDISDLEGKASQAASTLEGLDSAGSKGMQGWAEGIKANEQHINALGGTLTGVGALITGGLVFNQGLVNEFGAAMGNVNSIAQVTQEELAGISDEVLNIASDTGQGPTTLAAGLYDIYSSGFKGAEGLEVLEVSANAANAGITKTDVAAKAVTQTLNAYGQGSEMAGHNANVLFKTVDQGVITFEQLATSMGRTLPSANALNVPIEELAGGYALMTKNGINASQSETQIAALMRSALKPTADLSDAVQEYGYESAAAMIKQEGFGAFLEFLPKAAGGSEEALFDLLGSSEAFNAALVLGQNEGADYIEMIETMNGAQEDGGAMQAALAKQMETTAFKMQKLGAMWDVARIKMGSSFTPMVNTVIDALIRLVGVFNTAPPALQKIVAFALGAVGAISLIAGATLLALPKIANLIMTVNALSSAGGGIGRLARSVRMLGSALRIMAIASTGFGLIFGAAFLAAKFNILGVGDAVDAFRQRWDSLGSAAANNPITKVLRSIGAALKSFDYGPLTKLGSILENLGVGVNRFWSTFQRDGESATESVTKTFQGFSSLQEDGVTWHVNTEEGKKVGEIIDSWDEADGSTTVRIRTEGGEEFETTIDMVTGYVEEDYETSVKVDGAQALDTFDRIRSGLVTTQDFFDQIGLGWASNITGGAISVMDTMDLLTKTFRGARERGAGPIHAALTAISTAMPGLDAVTIPVYETWERLQGTAQRLQQRFKVLRGAGFNPIQSALRALSAEFPVLTRGTDLLGSGLDRVTGVASRVWGSITGVTGEFGALTRRFGVFRARGADPVRSALMALNATFPAMSGAMNTAIRLWDRLKMTVSSGTARAIDSVSSAFGRVRSTISSLVSPLTSFYSTFRHVFDYLQGTGSNQGVGLPTWANVIIAGAAAIEEIFPIFENLQSTVSGFLMNFISAFRSFSPFFGPVEGFFMALSYAVPPLSIAFYTLSQAVGRLEMAFGYLKRGEYGKMFQTLLMGVAQAIVGVIALALQLAIVIRSTLINAIRGIDWGALGSGILDGLSSAFDWVRANLGDRLGNWLADLFDDDDGMGGGMQTRLGKGLSESMMDKLEEASMTAWERAWSNFRSWLSDRVEPIEGWVLDVAAPTVTGWIDTATSWLGEKINAAVDRITTEAWTFMMNEPQVIWGFDVQDFMQNTVAEALVDGVNAVLDFILEPGDTTESMFTLKNALIAAGVAMLAGLVITGGIGALLPFLAVGALAFFGTAIYNAVRNYLDANPTKLEEIKVQIGEIWADLKTGQFGLLFTALEEIYTIIEKVVSAGLTLNEWLNGLPGPLSEAWTWVKRLTLAWIALNAVMMMGGLGAGKPGAQRGPFKALMLGLRGLALFPFQLIFRPLTTLRGLLGIGGRTKGLPFVKSLKGLFTLPFRTGIFGIRALAQSVTMAIPGFKNLTSGIKAFSTGFSKSLSATKLNGSAKAIQALQRGARGLWKHMIASKGPMGAFLRALDSISTIANKVTIPLNNLVRRGLAGIGPLFSRIMGPEFSKAIPGIKTAMWRALNVAFLGLPAMLANLGSGTFGASVVRTLGRILFPDNMFQRTLGPGIGSRIVGAVNNFLSGNFRPSRGIIVGFLGGLFDGLTAIPRAMAGLGKSAVTNFVGHFKGMADLIFGPQFTARVKNAASALRTFFSPRGMGLVANPKAFAAFSQIDDAFRRIVGRVRNLGGLGKAFGAVSQAVANITSRLPSLSGGFGMVARAASRLSPALRSIAMISSFLGLEALIGKAGGLSGIWDWLKDSFSEGGMRGVIGDLSSMIWDGISALPGVVRDAFSNLRGMGMSGIWDWITESASNINWQTVGTVIILGLTALIGGIPGILLAIAGPFLWDWLYDSAEGIQWGRIGSALQSGFQSAWDWLNGDFENFLRGPLADAITGLFDGIDWGGLGSSLLEGIQSAAQTAWDWLNGDFETWLRGAVTGAWDWLREKGSELLDSLYDGLVSGWEATRDFMLNLGSTVAGLVSGAWDWLRTKGVELLGSLYDGLVSGWEAVRDFMLGLGSAVSGLVSGAWSWLREKGAELIGSLYNGLVSGWELVRNFMLGLGSAVSGLVSGAWDWLREKGAQLLQSLYDGLVSGWEIVRNFMMGLADSLMGLLGLGAAWDWLKAKGAELLGSLYDGLVSGWELARDFMLNLGSTLQGLVSGGWDWLREKGAALLRGLYTGMVSGWELVRDFMLNLGSTLQGLVSGSWDWLKAKGQEMLDLLREGMETGWERVKNFVLGIPLAIQGLLPDHAGGFLLSFGEQLLDGLWEGAKNVWTKIEEWAGKIPGLFKDALGTVASWFGFGGDGDAGVSADGLGINGEQLGMDVEQLIADGVDIASGDVIGESVVGLVQRGVSAAASGGIEDNLLIGQGIANMISRAARDAIGQDLGTELGPALGKWIVRGTVLAGQSDEITTATTDLVNGLNTAFTTEIGTGEHSDGTAIKDAMLSWFGNGLVLLATALPERLTGFHLHLNSAMVAEIGVMDGTSLSTAILGWFDKAVAIAGPQLTTTMTTLADGVVMDLTTALIAGNELISMAVTGWADVITTASPQVVEAGTTVGELTSAGTAQGILNNLEIVTGAAEAWAITVSNQEGPMTEAGTINGELTSLGVATGILNSNGNITEAAGAWPGLITAYEGQMRLAGETVGIAAGDGVAAGLRARTGAVRTAANEIISIAMDAMDTAAELGSPSKITTGYGGFMAEGLGVGMLDSAGGVVNAAVSVVRNALDAAKREAGIASPARQWVPPGSEMSNGLAQGITSGQSAVVNAAISAVRAALKAARAEAVDTAWLDSNAQVFTKNTWDGATKYFQSMFHHNDMDWGNDFLGLDHVSAEARKVMLAVGKDVANGYYGGVNQYAHLGSDATTKMVLDARDAAKKSMGINSPSREMAYLGQMSSKGLERGIHTGAPGVTSAAVGVVNAAIAAAKRTAGIASPAREMVPVGVLMSDGLAVGIVQGKSKVVDAMASVVKASINEANQVVRKDGRILAEDGSWVASNFYDTLGEGIRKKAGGGLEWIPGHSRNLWSKEIQAGNHIPWDTFKQQGIASGKILGNGMIAGFSDSMEIRSPSRVLKRLGELGAKGFVLGFERHMDRHQIDLNAHIQAPNMDRLARLNRQVSGNTTVPVGRRREEVVYNDHRTYTLDVTGVNQPEDVARIVVRSLNTDYDGAGS